MDKQWSNVFPHFFIIIFFIDSSINNMIAVIYSFELFIVV